MRTVTTRRPSFPDVPCDRLIETKPGERWQVVCGDEGRWRVGIYSPPECCLADMVELEQHDCPEFFLLLSGRLTLVLGDGGTVREVPLEPGRPILVKAPHCGYCPDGPHTGVALVVERDEFDTAYESISKFQLDRA